MINQIMLKRFLLISLFALLTSGGVFAKPVDYSSDLPDCKCGLKRGDSRLVDQETRVINTAARCVDKATGQAFYVGVYIMKVQLRAINFFALHGEEYGNNPFLVGFNSGKCEPVLKEGTDGAETPKEAEEIDYKGKTLAIPPGVPSKWENPVPLKWKK